MTLHLLLVLSGAIPRRERDDRGATTVEYGLIIAVCVLGFVGGIATLKMALNAFHGGMQSDIDNWE